MVFWVHSQKPDLFCGCEGLNKYDVMDINIELSDDDKGNDANSDDNIIIESKLDNEKISTINTITV